jgi:S-adenosylmethionine hydrolase
MGFMPTTPLIVLTTDFGLTDPFVGIMKGVITKITPDAHLVDLNHNIPPGDIRRAAITLFQSCSYFPVETIFLTVIDPRVGTSRRGIILHTSDYTFIGPDNGLFTYLLDESTQIWELTNSSYQLPNLGATFHGRDIFAPCAAYVALGVHGSEFGPPVFDEVRIPYPEFQISVNGLKGEVLFSDRFGNILTSLGRFTRLDERNFTVTPWVKVISQPTQDIQIDMKQAFLHLPGSQELPWVNTFADIEEGLCAGLVGSGGLMEIVANKKSAAELLNLSESDSITLRFLGGLNG